MTINCRFKELDTLIQVLKCKGNPALQFSVQFWGGRENFSNFFSNWGGTTKIYDIYPNLGGGTLTFGLFWLYMGGGCK